MSIGPSSKRGTVKGLMAKSGFGFQSEGMLMALLLWVKKVFVCMVVMLIKTVRMSWQIVVKISQKMRQYILRTTNLMRSVASIIFALMTVEQFLSLWEPEIAILHLLASYPFTKSLIENTILAGPPQKMVMSLSALPPAPLLRQGRHLLI